MEAPVPTFVSGAMRRALARLLTPAQMRAAADLYRRALSRVHQADLNRLATIHGTDKWNDHWYTQHYQTHFKHLRRQRLNILEIGVGGNEDPLAGARSLRMWKYYFPNSRIYGIDIYDKSALQEDRITIFRGSQADRAFLIDVVRQIGEIDIVIDDGSHVNEHVLTSFTTLYPLLREGGIYAIEDTDHSYMPSSGGDGHDLRASRTVMNYFKSLTDGLNYEVLKLLGVAYEPSYFDKNTLSIHFYYNLIILHKGREPRQYLARLGS